MSGEIKIDVDGLTEDIQTLKTGISDFESYSVGFFEDVVESLSPFNSDFIKRISRTLENMRDNRTPELQTKLNNYVQCIETAKDTFVEVDTKLSEIFIP